MLSLVETKDLLEALDAGQLAGIDTYEEERPYVPKNFEGKEISDQVEGGLNAVREVVETGTASTRVN